MGDRAHLLSASIRLGTHIQDVLNLIACEELDDIGLVGHSYGGMVITGVADALLQSQPGVLRHLVYADAVTPEPGESWCSQHTSEIVNARIQAAKNNGGIAILPPDASIFGLLTPFASAFPRFTRNPRRGTFGLRSQGPSPEPSTRIQSP